MGCDTEAGCDGDLPNEAYWDELLQAQNFKSALVSPSATNLQTQNLRIDPESGDLTVMDGVVRLVARDTLGRPVPGLRVTLRNLQQTLYPQLPASYHVVSCALQPRCVTQLQENAGLLTGSTPVGGDPLSWTDPELGITYLVEIAGAVTSGAQIPAPGTGVNNSGLKITITKPDGNAG